ncbi:hypothetical protein GUJ93_ZPchr0007g5099 [Zizania palustris]|uniref:Uncharacterized protein n=1 Tax=Zizania palustris TaxID=103762 RepID=A0A8J5T913_ZIZPA|nr:hypothetical protein GUJ93_ZPchr0007g5099 [Zizania palustris]
MGPTRQGQEVHSKNRCSSTSSLRTASRANLWPRTACVRGRSTDSDAAASDSAAGRRGNARSTGCLLRCDVFRKTTYSTPPVPPGEEQHMCHQERHLKGSQLFM